MSKLLRAASLMVASLALGCGGDPVGSSSQDSGADVHDTGTTPADTGQSPSDVPAVPQDRPVTTNDVTAADDRTTVVDAPTTADAGDGGASPSPDAAICGGASIGRGGGYCAGPTDRPLPLSCCTGWNCDDREIQCGGIPPTCAAGEVHATVAMCWGPCVPAANCAPFTCNNGRCPVGFRCDSGMCRPS